MNTEYYIAKRFSFDKEGKKLLSRSIVRLSVFSISLSIAVMIISLAVVTGFKKEIRNKVVGFGSHVQILNFDANNSYESSPIRADQEFLPVIEGFPEVSHIQTFITKPGIIKAGIENQGVIAKGIGEDFDWSFFESNLVEGKTFNVRDSLSNDVLISKKLASMLQIEVGDKFRMIFFAETPRFRVFTISGLYETSLEEFDRQFILVDSKHLQKIYGWDDTQISGFEILIDDYSKIDEATQKIMNIAGYHFLDDGTRLRVVSIKNKHPQIFQWLNLLDMNVAVILFLMIVVAIVNMISGLIIMILERTNTIGLLKAIGASNASIKQIFRYQSFFLIAKGLIIGNFIALTICIAQDRLQIFKLDQSSYFIDYVPINLTVASVLLINIGALAIIYLTMYLPTLMIMSIDPVKTLRYN